MRYRWKVLALAGAWLLLNALGVAHAAPDISSHDRAASPRSLPADNLPTFGMLDEGGSLVPVPATVTNNTRRGASAELESTAPGPSMSLAIEAARAAVEACTAAGYRVGVAVIDSVGEARAMLTADGSDGSHVFVAVRKALVALRFEMPSSKASELVPKDPELVARVTPNMFVAGGAVPIMVSGETIGAIGVSGAHGAVLGQQDELCANAGLRKIAKQLK
jgi:uncharacterized protein GlcG (DUF336 family)